MFDPLQPVAGTANERARLSGCSTELANEADHHPLRARPRPQREPRGHDGVRPAAARRGGPRTGALGGRAERPITAPRCRHITGSDSPRWPVTLPHSDSSQLDSVSHAAAVTTVGLPDDGARSSASKNGSSAVRRLRAPKGRPASITENGTRSRRVHPSCESCSRPSRSYCSREPRGMERVSLRPGRGAREGAERGRPRHARRAVCRRARSPRALASPVFSAGELCTTGLDGRRGEAFASSHRSPFFSRASKARARPSVPCAVSFDLSPGRRDRPHRRKARAHAAVDRRDPARQSARVRPFGSSCRLRSPGAEWRAAPRSRRGRSSARDPLRLRHLRSA